MFKVYKKEIEVAGTWSLTGDKLTITYDQNEFRDKSLKNAIVAYLKTT